MDGIANVARQQQSQVGSAEVQGRAQEQSQQVQQSSQTRTKQSNVVKEMQNSAVNDTKKTDSKESVEDLVKEMQNSAVNDTKKTDSKESVEDLVKQLNDALSPLNTNIKFGVDKNDIFYVAAIDTKTNTMIRRYPAEQAQDFLPKMQEVSGILFDSKG